MFSDIIHADAKDLSFKLQIDVEDAFGRVFYKTEDAYDPNT